MKDYPKREELYEHLDLFGKTLSDKFDKKLEEKFRFYPTKDELFKRLDHIVGELDTIRTEHRLTAHSQEDQEDRLSKLEEIHPGGRHAFVPA